LGAGQVASAGAAAHAAVGANPQTPSPNPLPQAPLPTPFPSKGVPIQIPLSQPPTPQITHPKGVHIRDERQGGARVLPAAAGGVCREALQRRDGADDRRGGAWGPGGGVSFGVGCSVGGRGATQGGGAWRRGGVRRQGAERERGWKFTCQNTRSPQLLPQLLPLCTHTHPKRLSTKYAAPQTAPLPATK
jgi:hypothetical protein